MGNPDDLGNNLDGGSRYVWFKAQTAEFYRFWYAAWEKHTRLHDQDVLNFIKRDPFLTSGGSADYPWELFQNKNSKLS
jgi:hypothetical protein